MAPALPKNARIAVTSNVGTVRRGDVVVFKNPDSSTSSSVPLLVKRVIALPGETISERGGTVYVNGQLLAEPYLASRTVTDCANFVPDCFPKDALPQSEYWLMGDNRTVSKDSRFFGPIARADITGVAVRVLAPPSAAGAVPGSSR